MANVVDILINAQWRGGSAVQRAQQELVATGRAAKATDVEFAAVQARSGMLGQKMGTLAGEVARGNLTVTEARDQYNEFAGSLATIDGQAEATGVNIGQLVTRIGVLTAAFGTAAIAAQRTFRLLEEGAGLELTRVRFDRLAESIGTTGDVLMTDLQMATRGMVSDMDLMRTATDVVGLGLVDTADDAIRLSRIVAALGASMDQVVLALSNQTTMRFDQIGIAVKGFEERLKELEAQGMSTERAFTEAFLQQGEEQIERVGEAADISVAPIQQMRVAWDNAVDSFKQEFAVALVEEVDWSQVARDMGDAAEQAATLARALARVAGWLDTIRQHTPGMLGARFREWVDDIIATEEALENQVRSLARSSNSVEEFTRILSQQGLVVSNQSGAFITLSGELVRVEDAYNDLHTATQTNAAAQEEARRTTEATTTALEEQGVALANAALAVDRYAQQLSAIEAFESRREGVDAGDLVSQQNQQQLEDEFNLQRDRIDLFLDFQSDLNDITQREEERRAQTVEQFEERRTQIVADHNARRAQQEAQLQSDIADVRSSLAEEQAAARAEANQRLEQLEKDHLARMAQIVADADVALEEAASRLDASAVVSIKRQRDRALAQEEANFEAQSQRIEQQLELRLQKEQEAAEKRIAALEAHLEERQEKEEKAHQEELRKLEQQKQKRLQQIKKQARDERRERERQYTQERQQLGQNWEARMILEKDWMDEILQQEEAWWQQRLGLVGGGGTTDGDGRTGREESRTGGDDDTGGSTGDRPSRTWLERTAMDVANPSSVEEFGAWRQFFDSLSDAQLARWIETNSDIDVPGYLHGIDRVPQTGLAMLHEGEAVLDAESAGVLRRALGVQAPAIGSSPTISAGRGGGNTLYVQRGAIVINPPPGMPVEEVGAEFERRLEQFWDMVRA